MTQRLLDAVKWLLREIVKTDYEVVRDALRRETAIKATATWKADYEALLEEIDPHKLPIDDKDESYNKHPSAFEIKEQLRRKADE